jgi:hypothetical protein
MLIHLAAAMLISSALARDVPGNVRSFYNRVLNGKCSGGHALQDGFYDKDDGSQSQSVKSISLAHRIV